ENAAKPQNILLDINKMKNKSFVIDCGSGCAMRYTAENITQNGTSIDVKFIVETYIDTILDEEPDTANFIFIYNEKYELQNVECEGESVLEGSSPPNQESYRKFSEDLLKDYAI
ncbi:MAG: hypothetical protein FWD66_08250, partial [Paludibacter sp.]|nr:hypothetical protein [Paludibacter sp.]